MTLSITAISRSFVVQVVDRRITTPKQILSEEHEKCFSLEGPGYRLALAFSGLATVKSYSTKDWLMDAILDIAKTKYELNQVFDSLTDRITGHFANDPTIQGLLPQQRVLEVMCSGYVATPWSVVPIYGKISNAADPAGAFKIERIAPSESAPANWAEVTFGGSGASLAATYKTKIMSRIEAGAPAHAIRSILEDVVRRVAKHPKSAGTVGQQMDSIILHANPSIPIEGGDYSAVAKNSIHIPSGITITMGQGNFAFKGMIVEDISDEPGPMSVPKVHRNQPCPCGSTKRYRDCHGRKGLGIQSPSVLAGLPGGAPVK